MHTCMHAGKQADRKTYLHASICAVMHVFFMYTFNTRVNYAALDYFIIQICIDHNM